MKAWSTYKGERFILARFDIMRAARLKGKAIYLTGRLELADTGEVHEPFLLWMKDLDVWCAAWRKVNPGFPVSGDERGIIGGELTLFLTETPNGGTTADLFTILGP